MNTKRLTELAMLIGVALIIFIIELQIPNPFPVPGIKLGLANIITVYAVYQYRVREVLMLVFCRVLLGSLFGGNMTALIYSLAGSILCLTGMLFLKRLIDGRHIWPASVFGAVLHNMGQLGVAAVIVGKGVGLYFQFLLVSGCLAGGFTGGCAQYVIHRFRMSDLRVREKVIRSDTIYEKDYTD